MLSAFNTAQGATYYVATTGSDSNPGTQAAPFLTISKGTNRAAAGDTVIVGNGTYGNNGFISDGSGGQNGYQAPVTISTAGTSNAWITVKAQNPGQAILDCGTTSSALGCDKYIYLNGTAAYWSFQGLVFTRGAFGGIGTDLGASNIQVIGCQFQYIGNWNDPTQIGEDGIGFNSTATNWLIQGNIFHDIGRTNAVNLDHGIYAEGTNVTIINNIFYNIPHGWGIQVANGATNWLIANNTFASPSPTTGGLIMLWNTITGMSITNNILYYPGGSYGISQYTATLSGCAINNNLVSGPSSIMANAAGCTLGSSNQVGPIPSFVSLSTYNFQEQAGSPSINAGIYLAAVPIDFAGVTRPPGGSTDIGAYEYVPPAPPPVISGVFLSNITTSSAVVNWSTDVASTSYTDYGPTGYTSTTPQNMNMVTQHSITISGLSAATPYLFRADSANTIGGVGMSTGTFTTASAVASTFSVSAKDAAVSITQGQSGTDAIAATLLAGNPVNVQFTTSSLPSGVTASFAASSCTATCGTTLTLLVSSKTAIGAYTITVAGRDGGSPVSTNIVLTVTAGGLSGNTTSGLAAWWKLNEGTGSTAHDSSGNGNVGAIKGGSWAIGRPFNSLALNGSGQYVSVNESASLEMTTQLSVAFWIKPKGTSNVDPRVVAKLYDWDVKLNGNAYPQFSSGSGYAVMNSAVSLNKWVHVVFTFSSGVLTGYLDGLPVTFSANTFTSGSLPAYAYGLFAGTDPTITNSYAGDLYDLRIYNRVLSNADAAALYSSTR